MSPEGFPRGVQPAAPNSPKPLLTWGRVAVCDCCSVGLGIVLGFLGPSVALYYLLVLTLLYYSTPWWFTTEGIAFQGGRREKLINSLILIIPGDELMVVVAPKPMWDAGSATTKQVEMGGSLTTPTAPQRTDVDPNRCGEPVNPLKGTLAL